MKLRHVTFARLANGAINTVQKIDQRHLPKFRLGYVQSLNLYFNCCTAFGAVLHSVQTGIGPTQPST
jgi:hypothetical protein